MSVAVAAKEKEVEGILLDRYHSTYPSYPQLTPPHVRALI